MSDRIPCKSGVLRYQESPGVLLSIGGMVTAQEFSQIMLEPVFAIPNAARRLSSPQNRIPILIFSPTS